MYHIKLYISIINLFYSFVQHLGTFKPSCVLLLRYCFWQFHGTLKITLKY